MIKRKAKIDIFEIDLFIYIGTRDEILKEVNKIQHKFDRIIDEDFENADAITFQLNGDLYILSTTEDLSILIHELYHCVHLIHNIIGTTINTTNDELGAYMIGYLFRKFNLQNLTK